MNERRQSTYANKINQILQLSDKDFKAAITKIIINYTFSSKKQKKQKNLGKEMETMKSNYIKMIDLKYTRKVMINLDEHNSSRGDRIQSLNLRKDQQNLVCL